MKSIRMCLLASWMLGVSGVAAFGQEKEATATAVAIPATAKEKFSPITVTVDLLGGQKINGTIAGEMTDIPFRSSLGEVKIQLMDVAGIKLASAEDSSTTIIFKNGDSITGATDLKTLSVDTEWGSAKINGSSVTSILMLPDLKWTVLVGLNGKRWSLVDSKATTTNATSSSTGALPSNATPRTSTGQLLAPPASLNSQPINGPRVISPQN